MGGWVEDRWVDGWVGDLVGACLDTCMHGRSRIDK